MLTYSFKRQNLRNNKLGVTRLASQPKGCAIRERAKVAACGPSTNLHSFRARYKLVLGTQSAMPADPAQ